MAIIISADDIKKRLKGYTPDQAEKFHGESARIADQEFKKAVKEIPYGEVILVCGGSASGKSEFLSAKLIHRKSVIFDGKKLSSNIIPISTDSKLHKVKVVMGCPSKKEK